MTLIKTQALLLKKINFQDSSTIIHFYTREHGKISIIAKGSRQIKSQFRGYLEPLNFLNIIYYYKPTREIQTLSKVDMLQNFVSNLNDIRANYISLAILELIDKLVHHNEENQRLFDMTINTLKYIDQNPNMSDLGLILFLLGAIKTLGYRIDLNNCHFCGADLNRFFFDEKNPQPVCYNCSSKYFDEISADQLVWLKYIDNIDLLNPLKPIKSVEKSSIIVDFLLFYAGIYFDFYPKLNSLEMLKYL